MGARLWDLACRFLRRIILYGVGNFTFCLLHTFTFSLRVTGIKRCAVPQLSEETLNFSLHHENFQKSRSFLLHDQSDELISHLSIFENFLSHNQGSLGYKDYIYALRSVLLTGILQLFIPVTRKVIIPVTRRAKGYTRFVGRNRFRSGSGFDQDD